MRLGLAICSLFPSGGLQRDCVRIARLLAFAGHQVTIVTADYRRAVDVCDVPIEVLPVAGFTNPLRDLRMGRQLAAEAGRFDRIIGFNKLPGLDVYFCADQPYAMLKPGLLHKINPKYRLQRFLERQVFGSGSRTSIIVLAERQITAYRSEWRTPADRFKLLPPTLDATRYQPGLRVKLHDAKRAELAVAKDALLWLTVASSARRKGIDRTLLALRRFPAAIFMIAGVFPGTRDAEWIMRQAERDGVAQRVRVLGHREDIPELMAAADLLVHPARSETTGTAILEAVVNGLPVIVTTNSGFAAHVSKAEAGIVLPEPLRQAALDAAIARAADASLRERWSANGTAYGATVSLTMGHASAAELMVGPLWGTPTR